MSVQIQLTDEECAALRLFLEETLGELSQEIVGTDNARYRHGLRTRRMALEAIWRQLPSGSAPAPRREPANA